MMADFLSPFWHVAAWPSLPPAPQWAWWVVLAVMVARAIGGALARRAHGGWGALPGGTIRAIEAAYMVALWLAWPAHGTELWGLVVPRPAVALLMLGLTLYHLNDGVHFAKNVNGRDVALPWAIAWRYSRMPIVWAVAFQCWPVLLVGPLIALGYKGAQWWGGPVKTPVDTEDQRPVDCWTAEGELVAGLVTCAAIDAVALIQPAVFPWPVVAL